MDAAGWEAAKPSAHQALAPWEHIKKHSKPFPFADPVPGPGLPETDSGLPGPAHFSSGLCLSH